MILDPAQERAVSLIHSWFTTGSRQSFTLGGYAGTGKTTTIRAVIEALGVPVHCCSPTGKAASVLESKLPEGVRVTTIHSFLYKPLEVTEPMIQQAEKTAEELKLLAVKDPRFRGQAKLAKKNARRLAKILEDGGCLFTKDGLDDFDDRDQYVPPLVIVDEASMIGDELERDLREKARKIMFVGDPGQLPPVEGTDFFSRNTPDFLLEEIHRQAADSTILRLAMAFRLGEGFKDWNDVDCVLVRGGLDDKYLAEADVVITGMNNTRRGLNRRLRGFHGYSGLYPQEGEQLMCLRNHRGFELVNGIPGVATTATRDDAFGDPVIDMAYGGRILKGLHLDPYNFRVYEEPKLSRRENPPKQGFTQFDFGYAITCHKSQGSEWPHVIVWDDRMREHDERARRRWCYTAATRASKFLTWIRS